MVQKYSRKVIPSEQGTRTLQATDTDRRMAHAIRRKPPNNKIQAQEIFTKNTDRISLKVFYVALLTSQRHRDKSRQQKQVSQNTSRSAVNVYTHTQTSEDCLPQITVIAEINSLEFTGSWHDATTFLNSFLANINR